MGVLSVPAVNHTDLTAVRREYDRLNAAARDTTTTEIGPSVAAFFVLELQQRERVHEALYRMMQLMNGNRILARVRMFQEAFARSPEIVRQVILQGILYHNTLQQDADPREIQIRELAYLTLQVLLRYDHVAVPPDLVPDVAVDAALHRRVGRTDTVPIAAALIQKGGRNVHWTDKQIKIIKKQGIYTAPLVTAVWTFGSIRAKSQITQVSRLSWPFPW